jgi:hypothetical protein
MDFRKTMSVMNTDDLDITMDSLNAAQSKIHRTHPEDRELWTEFMDLLDDLHAAWGEAFLRKQLAGSKTRRG